MCSYRQSCLIFISAVLCRTRPCSYFVSGIRHCGKGKYGVLCNDAVGRQRGIGLYATMFTAAERYMETVRRFRSLTITSRRRTAAFFKCNGYHGICSYRQCRLVFVIRIRYSSCPLRFIIGIGRCGKGECGILLYHTVFRQHRIGSYRTMVACFQRYLVLLYIRFGALRTTCHHYCACQ